MAKIKHNIEYFKTYANNNGGVCLSSEYFGHKTIKIFIMKYVYLIQSLENGYYKIGVSKSPILRMKQLNTGNSSLLKMVGIYPTELPYRIEKILHNMYSYCRINNKEWFDLSIKEEAQFINECAKIEKNITDLIKAGNEFI